MYRAGTHSEGEVEVIAQSIGKEKLGGREGNVLFGNAQNPFPIILCAVGHIVLQVDAALGEACTAGAIEPEGTIIFARLSSLQARGSFVHPLFKVMQRCRFSCPSLFKSDDHNMSQVLELWKNWQ